MRVSRVEIFGFKSFMEKLVLPLDTGVTGVVGPNGCGKSNIVDAIRWVLGETRAKSLRGGTLEDVIFNGTDKLKPLGLAEVSLVLRADDENFFGDLVSQNLEADNLLKQLDVIEEKSDEVEQKANEVKQKTDEVSQEEVEDISDKETQDASRKPKFEVIDGSKGGSQQENEEEEGKLTDNQGSSVTPESARLLNRMSWLKSANEIQVTRRLYRSGESEFFINKVVCRLKDIKELFRAVGLGARAYTIVAQGEIGRIVTAKGDERRKILEEAAGVQGFREKIAVAERRLKDTSVNISRIDDIVTEVERQVRSLKRQANRAKNRANLKASIKELEEQIYYEQCLDIKQKIKSLNEEKENLRAEIEEKKQNLVDVQNGDQELKVELDELEKSSNELRQEVSVIRDKLNQKQINKATVKSKLSNIETFIESNLSAIENSTNRISSYKEKLVPISDELEKFTVKIKDKKSDISNVDTNTYQDVKEKQGELITFEDALHKKRKQKQTERETLVHIEAELRVIEKQIKSILLKSGAIDNSSKNQNDNANISVLSDKINVDEKYARALQAVIGDLASFQIVDNPHSAGNSYLTAYKEKRTKQVSGFVGKGLQNKNEIHNQNLDGLECKSILDLVNINDEVKPLISHILKSTYVVQELNVLVNYLENNIEKLRDSNPDIKFVTLDGEVLTINTFAPYQESSGLIELKSRKSVLDDNLLEQKRIISALDAELNELEQKVQAGKHALNSARDRHEEAQKTLRLHEHQLAMLEGEFRGQEKAKASMLNNIEYAEKEIANFQSKLKTYEVEKESVAIKLKEIENDTEDEKLRKDLEVANSTFSDIEKSRTSKREELIRITNMIESRRRALEGVQHKLSDINVKSERFNVELKYLFESVESSENKGLKDIINDVSSDSMSRLSKDELHAAKQELQQIKNRINREGEVDSSSIERLEEEETRLNDLIAQRDDLNSAKQTLSSTISKLREISTERFVKTYEAVGSNFSKLIPRLFGGGKGELNLSDPKNPLESELLISVRPPGKKLKSLELLSGGEKAICATGLIFAMFLERPSPLCILDEVDAPLDDANVGRFLNAVKEMSERTQFIMVTHNKQSMSVADNLVGVTMQQPGASKVLQVSLNEAYQHVA